MRTNLDKINKVVEPKTYLQKRAEFLIKYLKFFNDWSVKEHGKMWDLNADSKPTEVKIDEESYKSIIKQMIIINNN